MKKKEFIKPLKIGQSEHKRTSLIDSYYSFIELVILEYSEHNKKNGIKGLNWNLNELKIIELFKEKGIYVGKKKKQDDVSREKTLFELLGLWKYENKKIIPTNFSIELKKNYSIEKNIFGMTGVEWGFFLIILMQKTSNNGNSAFIVMDNILKNKPDYYIEYKELIKEYMSMNNEELIKNILPLIKMGSSNGKKNSSKILKDEIMEKWLEYSIFGGDSKEVLSMVYKNADLLSFSPRKFISRQLEFLLNNDIYKKEFKKNISKKSTLIEGVFPRDREDLLERCKNRIIGGIKSEYSHLNKNHLCSLPLFYKEKNNILVVEEYREFIEKAIVHKDEILNTIKEKGYITPESFSNIININEVKNKPKDILNIYKNEYGSLEKILNILNLFVINNDEENGEFKMRKRVSNYIKKSEHLHGVCSEPTFYEFITSFAVLFKNNKTLFEEDSDNFINIIKKSLNLTFGSLDMSPQRFASGGRADAIIYNEKGLIIIVEPTLQLYRQTKMEADAVADHINKFTKEQLDFGLFVSPIIEKRVKSTFYSWKKDGLINCEVHSFSQEQFIEYLKSG